MLPLHTTNAGGPPVDTSHLEASLDRLLRAHPCQDGEMMSYDLQQAFRSISYTVVDKSVSYHPLRSEYVTSSLPDFLSIEQNSYKEGNHNSSSSVSSRIPVEKKRFILGREAVWYAMCVKATQSPEDLQTLVYLSAKLLCEEATNFGEGNEKPYAGDSWVLALLSYGLSHRHAAIKSNAFYSLERTDRRYLLGHLWLSIGTLRFLVSASVDGSSTKERNGTVILDASHHCWFRTVSEHYPTLLESWITVLLPKIAEIAEGKGAGGGNGIIESPAILNDSSTAHSPVAAAVESSISDSFLPSRPFLSSRPSLLMGEANNFIIHSFYYLSSDILAIHHATLSKQSSSSPLCPRLLDREVPQKMWTVIDVLRRALERACKWLEEEIHFWRMQQKSDKKKEMQIKSDAGGGGKKGKANRSAASGRYISTHGDAHRQVGLTSRGTAKRLGSVDKALLDQVRSHTMDVLTSLVRKQSEFHSLRERVREQYGEEAKDYHSLSEVLWEHTLELCVVVRSLTESYMRALGGLGIFSSCAMAPGRKSVSFVPSSTRLLEYVASCVAMVPSVEFDKAEEEMEIMKEEDGKSMSTKADRPMMDNDKNKDNSNSTTARTSGDVPKTGGEVPRDAALLQEEKERAKEKWNTLKTELMLLSAASAVAYACPLREMQQALWSSRTELTMQIQSILTHRCLRRGSGGQKKEGEWKGSGDERYLFTANNRISQLSAQLLRSIWSFSLDPAKAMANVGGASSSTSYRSSTMVSPMDFLSSASDQLLEMLQTPSFSTSSGVSSRNGSASGIHRDPAALCVIELLSRAAVERPHHLIPALFRLLEHGNRETRKNVLDVLSSLPHLPLETLSSPDSDEELDDWKEEDEEEDEEEEREEKNEEEWINADDRNVAHGRKEGFVRADERKVARTSNSTTDRETHRHLAADRKQRRKQHEKERMQRLMSMLAQHLLVHLHDEELCLRMQSADLFSRVLPEDVLHPLLNLSLQADSTGRRYSSAITALKSVVKAHSHNAQILVDIAVYCYEKGEWSPARNGDPSAPPHPEKDTPADHKGQKEDKEIQQKSDDNEGGVQHTNEECKSPKEGEDGMGKKEEKKSAILSTTTTTTDGRPSKQVKFHSPGDVLPRALLDSTESSQWLPMSLSSSDSQAAPKGPSTSTPDTAPLSIASKQERLSGVFLSLARHWVAEVQDWRAETHVTPLLHYALSAPPEDLLQQQWLVKHILEVLQRILESASAASVAITRVEEGRMLDGTATHPKGLRCSTVAVMDALLPYFFSATLHGVAKDTVSCVDAPGGATEREKGIAAGVEPLSDHLASPPSSSSPTPPPWESAWLREWRECLTCQMPSSSLVLPRMSPPSGFYRAVFPLLCLRRCFSSLRKYYAAPFAASSASHPFFSYLLSDRGSETKTCFPTPSPSSFSSVPKEVWRGRRRPLPLRWKGGIWESLWLLLTHPAYRGCAKRMPEFVGVEMEILSSFPSSWFRERWKEDVVSLLGQAEANDVFTAADGELLREAAVSRSTFTTGSGPSTFSSSSVAPLSSYAGDERIWSCTDDVVLQLVHYYWFYIVFFTRLVVECRSTASSSPAEEDERILPVPSSSCPTPPTTIGPTSAGRTTTEEEVPLTPPTDVAHSFSHCERGTHCSTMWMQEWIPLPLLVLVHIVFPWLSESPTAAEANGSRGGLAVESRRPTTPIPPPLSAEMDVNDGAWRNDGKDVPFCTPFPLRALQESEEGHKLLTRLSLAMCELFAGLLVRSLWTSPNASDTNPMMVGLAPPKKENKKEWNAALDSEKVEEGQRHDHTPHRMRPTEGLPIVSCVSIVRPTCGPNPEEGKGGQKVSPTSPSLLSLPVASLCAVPWEEALRAVVWEPIAAVGVAYRTTSALSRSAVHENTAPAPASPFSTPYVLESFMFAARIHEGFMQHFTVHESAIPLMGRYMRCLVPLLVETANAAANCARPSLPGSERRTASTVDVTKTEDNGWLPTAEQCGRLLFQSLMFTSRISKEVLEKYVRTVGETMHATMVQEQENGEVERVREPNEDAATSRGRTCADSSSAAAMQVEGRRKTERSMQEAFHACFPSPFQPSALKMENKEKNEDAFCGDPSSSTPPLPQTLLELLGEAFVFPIASFALGCLRFQVCSSSAATAVFHDIGIKLFAALLGIVPEMILLAEDGNLMRSAVGVLRHIAQLHPTPATRKLAEHVVSLIPDDAINEKDRSAFITQKR